MKVFAQALSQGLYIVLKALSRNSETAPRRNLDLPYTGVLPWIANAPMKQSLSLQAALPAL
jgi:hypothetical protein